MDSQPPGHQTDRLPPFLLLSSHVPCRGIYPGMGHDFFKSFSFIIGMRMVSQRRFSSYNEYAGFCTCTSAKKVVYFGSRFNGSFCKRGGQAAIPAKEVQIQACFFSAPEPETVDEAGGYRKFGGCLPVPLSSEAYLCFSPLREKTKNLRVTAPTEGYAESKIIQAALSVLSRGALRPGHRAKGGRLSFLLPENDSVILRTAVSRIHIHKNTQSRAEKRRFYVWHCRIYRHE